MSERNRSDSRCASSRASGCSGADHFTVSQPIWGMRSPSIREIGLVCARMRPRPGQFAFLAAEGEHLHADANAQHRPLRRGELHHRIPQTGSVQRMHACIECTDSREDQPFGVGRSASAGGDFRLNAKLAEHIGYRTDIADTVVDDAYLSHDIFPTPANPNCRMCLRFTKIWSLPNVMNSLLAPLFEEDCTSNADSPEPNTLRPQKTVMHGSSSADSHLIRYALTLRCPPRHRRRFTAAAADEFLGQGGGSKGR